MIKNMFHSFSVAIWCILNTLLVKPSDTSVNTETIVHFNKKNSQEWNEDRQTINRTCNNIVNVIDMKSNTSQTRGEFILGLSKSRCGWIYVCSKWWCNNLQITCQNII